MLTPGTGAEPGAGACAAAMSAVVSHPRMLALPFSVPGLGGAVATSLGLDRCCEELAA
jgi:hypothetical protein